MYELNLVDKENNPNHMNLTFRRRKKLSKPQQEPVPSPLEATFNPLPKINKIVGPFPLQIQRPTKTIQIPDDLFEGFQAKWSKPSIKQGPVIAKSAKLKSFFQGCESQRYGEKRRHSVNQVYYRGGSLETIGQRKPQNFQSISRTLIPKKAMSKKEQFIQLYKKQKREYDRMLLKYGISETVQDQAFAKFIQE